MPCDQDGALHRDVADAFQGFLERLMGNGVWRQACHGHGRRAQ
jgi:hypothetical protein